MLKKTGITYFLHGFKLITQPGIKRFVVIPLLLNLLLFLGLFIVAKHFVGEVNTWLTHLLPTWLHWLRVVVWVLFYISFFLMLTYTYATLANLVSAPFNGLLAEKVALHLTSQPLANIGLLSIISDIPRIFGRQLAIIGYYLPRALGLGILFFIPIVQLVAAPLWFLFHAWFMALQFIDYPTDNQRIPLREVRMHLSSRRWLNLTFGSSVLLASMVPFFNIFVMPAAIAGATELWLLEYGSVIKPQPAQSISHQ